MPTVSHPKQLQHVSQRDNPNSENDGKLGLVAKSTQAHGSFPLFISAMNLSYSLCTPSAGADDGGGGGGGGASGSAGGGGTEGAGGALDRQSAIWHCVSCPACTNMTICLHYCPINRNTDSRCQKMHSRCRN
eukprot:scaffold159484_cov45-Prasinocladus_malaysianus.AAC.1